MNIHDIKNYGNLLAKVWSDKNYLTKLTDNPKQALKDEGFRFSSDLNLSIKKGARLAVDTTGDLIEITLPPSPDEENEFIEEMDKLIASDMYCIVCTNNTTKKSQQ
jgi:predicted adenine nucleotide alpha hydrolase (AANH) superfamily ATPase